MLHPRVLRNSRKRHFPTYRVGGSSAVGRSLPHGGKSSFIKLPPKNFWVRDAVNLIERVI